MMEQRLARIKRASDELDRCVRERGPRFDPMATLGELDWLEELHLALYEQEAKATTMSETAETICGNCYNPKSAHGVFSGVCKPGVPGSPRFVADRQARAIDDPKPTTGPFPAMPVRYVVEEKKPHHGGLPDDAKARKTYPIFSGLLSYFPDALAETSHVSHVGNQQHNPGEPLRWAQEKSQDELDAMMRHLTDEAKGVERDTDGQYHLAKVIWRASAALQRKIEAKRRGMTVEQYNRHCREQANCTGVKA